ncbi:forkhead box protein M1 isoform X3 [Nelusetta ayraudi]|uniref:forkhead box protein M1 isoform X3 n=1 Tax=Nelusetta ayraudi TaxID=303726 RepID=UPI003F709569
MRRSPRRPLILRRKLPFHQNEPAASKTQSPSAASGTAGPPEPVASTALPDGIRVLDHPSRSDTQVVVMLKTADLQSVIGALKVKGKECGAQGPNKFILLGANDGGFPRPAAAAAGGGGNTSALSAAELQVKTEPKSLADIKTLNKDVDGGRLDDSLTNIQWLGKMSSSTLESGSAKGTSSQENQEPNSQTQTPKAQTDEEAEKRPNSERPPFSYMAMIQFAINSRKNRRMTLKEIYTWFEDNFPYFREVAKPGWKNSIRHNLSLHDMFLRETSPDGKISYWTIRPEANRRLTLEQVYKPASDPVVAPAPVPLLFIHQQQQQQQQRRSQTDTRKTPAGCERRMKPLLPRTDSYLLPIQLPIVSSLFLPSPSSQLPPCSSQKQSACRGAKRVRIAPKVKQEESPAFAVWPSEGMDVKEEPVDVKAEPLSVPLKCETPRSTPKRASRRSRRKQHLVHSRQEEPVLLCSHNTLFDSGLASDASTLQSVQGAEADATQSPDREFSFKTPIKSGGGGGGGGGCGNSSSHLTSSTPSKPPCGLPDEAWKVTPLGKGAQDVLDFSPIRTPGGPTVTPRQDYTTYSLGGTPFKDWPLFNSPGELLASATPATATPTGSSARSPPRQPGHSLTEGLMLDTMNDSLSNILVDISFSCLDDDDLGTANISWSELTYQFK